MFKTKQRVVKILNVMGIETAIITTIKKKSKGRVQCDGDEHLWYDAESGHEINPVIPGCSSRLILVERD